MVTLTTTRLPLTAGSVEPRGLANRAPESARVRSEGAVDAPTRESAPTRDTGLMTPNPRAAKLDLDALERAHDGAFAEHAAAFFHSAGALGLMGTDVMQRIYSDLMAGDVQSALDTFNTLQRIIEASTGPATVSGGKASEDRESTKVALETASTEANIALERNLEALREYRQAMRELEAMQARMEQQMAELEAKLDQLNAKHHEAKATLEERKESAEGKLDASALEIGQSMRDRRRALARVTEPTPITEELLAQVEDLAAQFASNPENAGYLTREQVSKLAGALFSVPKMHRYEGKLVRGGTGEFIRSLGMKEIAAVQVDPKLVDAALRGLSSIGDEAAIELMGAQLALHVSAGANAVMRGATLEGYGKEAVQHLRRSSSGLMSPRIDFEPPAPDAAPVTLDDRLGRRLNSDGTRLERISEFRNDYEPGDVLELKVRIAPSEQTEFPMTLSGHAGFTFYPAGTGPREREYFSLEINDNGNGELSVLRRAADRSDKIAFAEPEVLPNIARNDDGSFDIAIEYQPMDTIEERRQGFAISLQGMRSSFTHELGK